MTNLIDAPDLKGSLVDGWTEEDVTYTARELRRFVGWDFVVVWEYNDMRGAGGHSTAYLRSGTGELYELPGCLWKFLCEDGDLDLGQLAAEIVAMSRAEAQPNTLTEIDGYNYCYTDYGPDTEA